MTDDVKTPEQIAADAAAALAGAGAMSPAPEAAKAPDAAVDPAAAKPDAPEAAVVEPAEATDLAPGQTLAAKRGIPAGPADHPRTVHHRKTH